MSYCTNCREEDGLTVQNVNGRCDVCGGLDWTDDDDVEQGE